MKIGVFCPTLHFLGGGEFVTVAIANTLAQNGYPVTLFATKKVDPAAVKEFFGEKLHPKIETVTQATTINPKGLAGFYQAIFRSYAAKTKCALFIDPYSNCVFPWTNISYIHYPILNMQAFNKKFPYLHSPHHVEVGIIPHVFFEKNLVDYKGKLVLANSHYTANEIKAYSGKEDSGGKFHFLIFSLFEAFYGLISYVLRCFMFGGSRWSYRFRTYGSIKYVKCYAC